MLGKAGVENRFGLHKAAIEGPEATNDLHKELRHGFKLFANVLDQLLPEHDEDCLRYKKLMFDALEDASMWSHKGIALTVPLINE
jgi:hypothetical protein